MRLLLTPYIKEINSTFDQYTRYKFPTINSSDWVATIWKFNDEWKSSNEWKSSIRNNEYDYFPSKEKAMERVDRKLLELDNYIFLSEEQFEKYKILL